jgi:glycosyltransferase involved in cell wall biosynthesis
MRIVISHPTANQNVRAAVGGFVEAGIVTSFKTTIATFPGGVWSRLASFKAFASLNRRCFDPALRPVTASWPWLELGRLLAAKTGAKRLTRHEKGLLSIDAVYRNLDKRVADRIIDGSFDAVYAYEDGALATFRTAKRLGIRCYYDLPIGYWRAGQKIFEQQREEWPEWSETLVGLQNSEEKLLRKDEEIYLSDKIFVASKFTAESLKDFPGTLPEIEVIPYGFPPTTDKRIYRSSENDPLKILFVGALTQRKGIANLFAAVDSFRNHVELTLVGKKPQTSCQALDNQLSKHKWIPTLSHDEVLALMRSNDVLVFPSLFEGFGLVITEAMSQGTPVITTDRTAGPDMMEHGVEGWIIKAGSTSAIQDAIEHLLSHRSLIKDAGEAAMRRARKRSWNVYGMELAQSVMANEYVTN